MFLDFDGVLNSEQSTRMWTRNGFKRGGLIRSDRFCPIAMSNLNELLIRTPDLMIVVSSTWRLGKSTEDLQKILLDAGLEKGLAERVISRTENSSDKGHSRGYEIQDWLDRTKEDIKDFIIVDDDSDMVHLKDKLHLTSWRHGLMWEGCIDIMKRLGDEGADEDFDLI